MNKYATEGNMIVVDVAYSINKAGITLSFACPVGVMEISEITELSKMFVKFVKTNYSDLIKGNFLAKSSSPYIFSKNEEVFMIWAFSGVEDKHTKQQLKNKKIRKIDYEV